MNGRQLADTARRLVAGDKGLLAIDESNATCNARFAKAGIPQTEEARRAYREMLLTTPDLGAFISGVILYDETIRQATTDGIPFLRVLSDAGIMTGIKVDLGAKAFAGFPGETVTEGLDGLRDRLEDYLRMGARFAKWRAVIALGDGLPTRACLEANAEALARYAALCQEAGLVPIVEPEIFMAGEHSLDRCFDTTGDMLRLLFNKIHIQGVMLEGMLLKPNMILPGTSCSKQETVTEVAQSTLKCLLRTVPASVPGISFLFGGQSGHQATSRLNALNAVGETARPSPWALTFSFGRALQQTSLDIWKGNPSNTPAAQHALHHRAMCNSAARRGQYNAIAYSSFDPQGVLDDRWPLHSDMMSVLISRPACISH